MTLWAYIIKINSHPYFCYLYIAANITMDEKGDKLGQTEKTKN